MLFGNGFLDFLGFCEIEGLCRVRSTKEEGKSGNPVAAFLFRPGGIDYHVNKIKINTRFQVKVPSSQHNMA